MAPSSRIGDLMTPAPQSLSRTDTALDAARAMRSSNIGAVIVTAEGGEIFGLLTDRDIIVRAVALGQDPAKTRLESICSTDPVCLAPTDEVGAAIKLMRKNSVRRVPVVENGKPVGIISLGDVAAERDPESALGQISAAPAQA